MLRHLSYAAVATTALAAAPAFSQEVAATGDAAAGEGAFRQCQSCHVVVSPDGETLAGRNARTGPNLYGVAGASFGHVEDYRYSDLMMAAGEQGAVYDEANFVAYVMDPTGHLRELTGESGRGKMTYKVRSEEDALNLYAYLAELAGGGEGS